MTYMKLFKNKKVKIVFDTYPPIIRKNLLQVREFIFEIASNNEQIGELDESLKWHQPSYTTKKSQSGTAIRLGYIELTEYVLYVHCQTTLIAEFKEVYPELKYDGNRAIIFDSKNKLPVREIKVFIYLALTYHHRKKSRIGF